jgi:hypothetical protein
VCGITLTVSPPTDWTTPDFYGKSWPSDIHSWKDHEFAKVSNILTAERVMRHYYSGELVPHCDSDDYGSITDVIGSGFLKKQGKTAVVNPCDSLTRTGSYSSGLIGSDSITLTPYAYTGEPGGGSGSTRTLVFRVRVSCTIARRVGLSQSAGIMLDEILYSNIPVPTDACDSIFSDAYAGIQEAEFDLLTTLAEANKTLKYATDRLRDAGRIIRSVRRGNFSFLKEKPPSIQDAWLEARYAIRPIVYDVSNAMQAFGSDKRLAPFIRSSRRDNLTDEIEIDTSYTSNGVTYRLEGYADVSHELRAGVYANLQHDLPNVKLLGLLNLASTAWELVPWSFVVDWFVNSSTIIASLNPNPVYAVNNGYCSINSLLIFNGTLTASAGTDEKVLPISRTLSRYQRVPRTEPSLISIDVNLSVPKLLDLLAFATR